MSFIFLWQFNNETTGRQTERERRNREKKNARNKRLSNMFDISCTTTLWKMCAWDNVTLIMYTFFSVFLFFLQLLILCGCCCCCCCLSCCCFWHFVPISSFCRVMWMFVVLSWFIKKKYATINRFMSLVYIFNDLI